MDFTIILVICGIIALIVAIIAASMWIEKKRTAALTKAAEELGLEFHPGGDQGLLDRLSGFQLFNQGRNRTLKNAIVGETGEVTIAIFDYTYKTGGGKNSQTHHQTVLTLESSQMNLPPFSMAPENLFHKIGAALGMQDIDFDTHPIFSKKFVLKSVDEAAVRAFFNDALLSYFEQSPGISVESGQNKMIYYRQGKRVKPEQIRKLFEDGYKLYGVLVDRNNPKK